MFGLYSELYFWKKSIYFSKKDTQIFELIILKTYCIDLPRKRYNNRSKGNAIKIKVTAAPVKTCGNNPKKLLTKTE